MWPQYFPARFSRQGGHRVRHSPEILAEGRQHILVGFEADAPHHQHAVTKQALDPLLSQLLEEVAAVNSNRVHTRP